MIVIKQELGHYSRIPLHIARTKVSEKAKSLWRELAFFSSPENPIVFADQTDLADKLNSSTRSVRRYIEELILHNLITLVEGRHEGHRRYKLAWFQADTHVHSKPKPDTDVHINRTPVSTPTGHTCPVLYKVDQSTEQSTKQNTFLEKTLLQTHGQAWTKSFACLDGLSGRPTIEECVTQALNHTARHKCSDVKIYIDSWLRNASSKWIFQYHRERSVPVTDGSLSREAVAKKLQEEKEQRERYWRRKRQLEEEDTGRPSIPKPWEPDYKDYHARKAKQNQLKESCAVGLS